MEKVKTYEFWFCTSIFCKARKNIKRARWWNKPILLALYTVTAKCKFKAIDITDEDALKIAKIEFEEDGYYEEIMGGYGMSEEQRGTVKAKTYSVPRSAIPHAPDGDGYYVTVVELADYMACLNRITQMSVENYHMKKRIAELESALNRHYESPDVYDMAIKQFESLAKSE